MLIKMAGYSHFPHVKGFKASLNVSVSGLGVSIFMSFRQTRRSGSTGAFTRLCTSLQNKAKLSSALMLFNVLMLIAAGDRHSAAETTFFADTHTQAVSMPEQIATQHQAKYGWSRMKLPAYCRKFHT